MEAKSSHPLQTEQESIQVIWRLNFLCCDLESTLSTSLIDDKLAQMSIVWVASLLLLKDKFVSFWRVL